MSDLTGDRTNFIRGEMNSLGLREGNGGNQGR